MPLVARLLLLRRLCCQSGARHAWTGGDDSRGICAETNRREAPAEDHLGPALSSLIPAFFFWDHVRLRGLKSNGLNGLPETIVEMIETNGRFGVLLHDSCDPKAINAINAEHYSPGADERCEK